MGRNILIVDDEVLIRQGIRARLSYLGFEFDKIIEAEDGSIALDILKQEVIDIVITDIRMSDMDGIEMIGKAKPICPNVQFVILSGYAEFSYAEKAIQLGVSAYLLKPIANDQLKKTMDTLLSQIEKEEQKEKNLKIGKRLVKENKQYEVEKHLNTLLTQDNGKKQEVNYTIEAINPYIDSDNKKMITAIINIDSESYIGNKFGYQDIKVIRFSIRNIFNECESNCKKIIVHNLANTNQLYVVLKGNSNRGLQLEGEKLLTTVQSILWNRMNISTTIGISSVSEKIGITTTKEAQKAVAQKLIHGQGNIYFYEDIEAVREYNLPTPQLHMLSQYIERKDMSNVRFLLNTLFSDEQLKEHNIHYLRMLWVRVSGILLKYANTGLEQNSRKVQRLVVDLDELETFSNMEEVRHYLWTIVIDCLESDISNDTQGKNKIQLAIRYITQNYNRDISINDLGEKFSISPNYFSAMFKKETGETTVNYIKALRIKKSKELLEETHKSVVDIANEVGYEDSQYFFKVFKKLTNQTPLQYRKQYQKRS